MAAMNMVSTGGFRGYKLSFKKMSTGGRFCTLQEYPHFWVPTIKVRQPDGTPTARLHAVKLRYISSYKPWSDSLMALWSFK